MSQPSSTTTRPARARWVRRATLMGAAMAVAVLGLPGLAATATAAPAPTVEHSARPHLDPQRGVRASTAAAPASGGSTKVCSGCQPPLLYGGGQVMGAPGSGQVTVTPIFWAPPGTQAFPAGYETAIGQYLTDVAHDSGLRSNGYSVATEYYQTTGSTKTYVKYDIAAGKTYNDSDPYPAPTCTVTGYTCVNDPQVQAELQSYLAANGLPSDNAHLYPVFFPPGVATDDGTGNNSVTFYCGYHTEFTSQQGTTVWANEPFESTDGCGAGQYPNNPDSDNAINTLTHEINEAITDPDGTTGWIDSAGNEIADECSTDYGPVVGTTGDPSTTGYDETVNGHPYYVQEMFSNADYASGPGRGCVISESAVGGTAAKDTVTVQASPSSIPADGASTSTVTVTVSGASGPVAGDPVTFVISPATSTAATCGTVNQQTVTTAGNGTATVTYTASSSNATCKIAATEAATGQSGTATVVQGTGTPPPPTQSYTPLAPQRIADTRPGSGYTGQGTPLAAGSSLTVPLPSSVPSGATAVVSVIGLNATSVGYLTAYPTGQPVPLASTLNYVTGGAGCSAVDCVVPNLSTVPVGANNSISIYNGGTSGSSADVVVDLEGYYATPAAGSTSGEYYPLTPARLADTRCSDPTTPHPPLCSPEHLPAANASLARPGPQGTVQVSVAGQEGVAASAGAAVLNVTVTDTPALGYLTAFPGATTVPLASNLNWVAGQTTANRVIVPVGSDGKVDLYLGSAAASDVVVDVVGYYSSATALPTKGSLFTPVNPIRLADTRAGSGEPHAGQTLGAGTNLNLQITGTAQVPSLGGVPAGATSVAVNVTATQPSSTGFFTLSPTPVTVAASSDVNFGPGETRANADYATLASAGSTDLFNNAGTTDGIVDLNGYFTAAGS